MVRDWRKWVDDYCFHILSHRLVKLGFCHRAATKMWGFALNRKPINLNRNLFDVLTALRTHVIEVY